MCDDRFLVILMLTALITSWSYLESKDMERSMAHETSLPENALRHLVLELYRCFEHVPRPAPLLCFDTLRLESAEDLLKIQTASPSELSPSDLSEYVHHCVTFDTSGEAVQYWLPRMCEVACFLDIDMPHYEWARQDGDPGMPTASYIATMARAGQQATWTERQRTSFADWVRTWWRAVLAYRLPDVDIMVPIRTTAPISRRCEACTAVLDAVPGLRATALREWTGSSEVAAARQFVRFVLFHEFNLARGDICDEWDTLPPAEAAIVREWISAEDTRNYVAICRRLLPREMEPHIDRCEVILRELGVHLSGSGTGDGLSER